MPAYGADMKISPVIAAFFGGQELLLLLLIILILFGGSKLPSLAKGLGQSIKEFKKASKDEEEEKAKSATPAADVKKVEQPTETHGSN